MIKLTNNEEKKLTNLMMMRSKEKGRRLRLSKGKRGNGACWCWEGTPESVAAGSDSRGKPILILRRRRTPRSTFSKHFLWGCSAGTTRMADTLKTISSPRHWSLQFPVLFLRRTTSNILFLTPNCGTLKLVFTEMGLSLNPALRRCNNFSV